MNRTSSPNCKTYKSIETQTQPSESPKFVSLAHYVPKAYSKPVDPNYSVNPWKTNNLPPPPPEIPVTVSTVVNTEQMTAPLQLKPVQIQTSQPLHNIPEDPKHPESVIGSQSGKPLSRPPQVSNNPNTISGKIKKHKRKTTSITELLRKIPALSYLPDYKFKELGRYFTEQKKFPKHTNLYRIQDSAKNLYFVKSGEIKLSNHYGQTLGSKTKGQFFGEEALTGANNFRFDTATVVSEEAVLYVVNNSGLYDDDTLVMSHLGTVYSSVKGDGSWAKVGLKRIFLSA